MNDSLQAYVQENLTKGFPKEAINNKLLEVGWKQEDITTAFKTVTLQLANPTSQQLQNFPTQLVEYAPVSIQISPSLLLQIGLAFVFFYAAMSLSLNPADGMHYLPSFVSTIVPAKIFLTFFGIYEIILSFWLVSGKKMVYSGFLAAITIFMITVFNLGSFTILFRNVAILFAALALGCIGIGEKRGFNNSRRG